MKHLKNSLIVFAGILAVTGAVTSFIPSLTQGQQSDGATKKPEDVRVINSPSEPVPVAGTISVGNVVQFQPAMPAGAFSISNFISESKLVSGPDPEGTSYAITGLTMANVHDGETFAIMLASWTDTDCSPNSPGFQSAGPRVQMRSKETVHLSFPQPFVFAAQPGASACLQIIGTNSNIAYTVVGYRF